MAAGLASSAAAIRAALADGYLRYPRVEAALASFRPVTVSGMVAKPGDYPYSPGMTAAQAVALAGGFDGQLDDTAAEITRHGAQGPVTRLMPVDGVELQPGDSLTITGRRRYRE